MKSWKEIIHFYFVTHEFYEAVTAVNIIIIIMKKFHHQKNYLYTILLICKILFIFIILLYIHTLSKNNRNDFSYIWIC